MASTMKASIILATYNWPEALQMVFAALGTQTEKSFEVMLADDGSDERTKKVIEQYQKLFPIKHFWQEHKGFRKSKILNRAITAASGDVLIFLDGDCVPHKDFVLEHIRAQDDAAYVCGRRVDLSKEFTEKLSEIKIQKGVLNGASISAYMNLFWDCLRQGGSTPFHRAYVVRTPVLRKLFKLDRVVDLKGCNFSVARKHMLAIDGFDESYEGYGREDTDVEIRLQNLGLKIKSGKNLCLQFHLWHEPRAFTPSNEDLLEEVKRTKRVKALKGISF